MPQWPRRQSLKTTVKNQDISQGLAAHGHQITCSMTLQRQIIRITSLVLEFTFLLMDTLQFYINCKKEFQVTYERLCPQRKVREPFLLSK